ncbi:wuschel-related homeobox 10 [Phtheirospermum japonicum]|uniref:Wuschel-related homeobox 10 n=1 Tax=Phtheirospermum japonicum TaxID=374723 RepID=A0A830DDD7_9LAMI|nr:wuschel-related homeobox 10 [Phtheirospermum japonicum]
MAKHVRAIEPWLIHCCPEPEPTVEIPARTRWTPTPEQITTLESIFDKGIVNPSKSETVGIKMLLETYGKVTKANIYFWFKNRRTKCRRQRLLQASGSGGELSQAPAQGSGSGPGGHTSLVGSSSSSSLHGNDPHNNRPDNFISFLGPVQEYEQNLISFSGGASGLYYQPKMITVFINGVPTEMERDSGTIFVVDSVMYHSSGMPVEVNEYGIVIQRLQHGESYFVVEHPRF